MNNNKIIKQCLTEIVIDKMKIADESIEAIRKQTDKSRQNKNESQNISQMIIQMKMIQKILLNQSNITKLLTLLVKNIDNVETLKILADQITERGIKVDHLLVDLAAGVSDEQ